jgi:transmembrane sensor
MIPSQASAELTSCREINARAAAFLERREFDTWTALDETELNAWLMASSTHCATYWRLEAVWKRTHRLAALTSPATVQASAELDVRSGLRWIAASVVAIAIFGAALNLYVFSPRDTVYETPVGGHRVIALADGSRIELNTDTVLRARITNTLRTVTLIRGEAYFRIKHDTTRSFVVNVAGSKVTDLGTAFSVRNDRSRVQVALFEGRARFDPSVSIRRHAPVTLMPGDNVVATAISTSVWHQSPENLANQLGWRRGVIIFTHTTLAEVANEFNRYNRSKLVIADPETARLTMGGTFPANNVELFGRMVTAMLGLHVSRRGDEVVISR